MSTYLLVHEDINNGIPTTGTTKCITSKMINQINLSLIMLNKGHVFNYSSQYLNYLFAKSRLGTAHDGFTGPNNCIVQIRAYGVQDTLNATIIIVIIRVTLLSRFALSLAIFLHDGLEV